MVIHAFDRIGRRLAAAGALVCLVMGARAQSFNLDTCFDAPSSAFGGAANQPGVWNAVAANAPIALRDLAGATSAATLRYTDNGATCAALLDGCLQLPTVDLRALLCSSRTAFVAPYWQALQFEGLEPGEYDLYLYARSYDPSSTNWTFTWVRGSPDPHLAVGGPFTWQGQFESGATHSEYRCTVAPDGVLEVRLDGGPFAVLNGAQLVRRGRSLAGPYCTPGLDSSGCRPRIIATGKPDASEVRGCTLAIVSAPIGRDCVLFYGVNGAASIPFSSASASTLCVEPPVQRSIRGVTEGVTSPCSGWFGASFNRYAHAAWAPLGSPFLAGEWVHAQAWIRDPTGAPHGVLSDAVRFVFRP